jgi:hypothetical protein
MRVMAIFRQPSPPTTGSGSVSGFSQAAPHAIAALVVLYCSEFSRTATLRFWLNRRIRMNDHRIPMLFFSSGMAFAAILAVAQEIPDVRSGEAQLLQQGRRTILELASPKSPVQRIALTHPNLLRPLAPLDAKLIVESPHHFLIFTDSFDSNPGNPQGECGAIGEPGERFVHVVALGARPHETLSVLVESCLSNLLPTPTSPEWLAKPDGAGFAGQLTLRFEPGTQPTTIYSVAPDGSVSRPATKPNP